MILISLVILVMIFGTCLEPQVASPGSATKVPRRWGKKPPTKRGGKQWENHWNNFQNLGICLHFLGVSWLRLKQHGMIPIMAFWDGLKPTSIAKYQSNKPQNWGEGKGDEKTRPNLSLPHMPHMHCQTLRNYIWVITSISWNHVHISCYPPVNEHRPCQIGVGISEFPLIGFCFVIFRVQRSNC